ncbi:hypothetical protein [Sulfuracidifex metallicus]|jgi:peptidoglycan hydrolase CwlO-like protein|uniref:Uncharacterized protein n=1 Tax=Sulfuracidifex metallicus DSM 6482 = JCM 9184 TaxID=523847 RepID=A0A6A9QHI3_SULME|nr:hypothetical protein [Sulfuracidifex metallicus]MUN28154.1 hypothetical protein [Sulfuracidifex metallicus DSM 6482 = JCM 9184]WOE51311.1 hypothetical protein RQ359_000582 [Sulfuracidifex metallicus DSM 6482 = JCM 9184]
MDLRIPKIPKNEDDLNEISKQLEHEHNNPEDLEHVVAELIGELQSIENRLTQSETDAKKLKEEISKIYLVLSKMILLISSNNEEDKIKNLKDLLSLLR